MFECVSVYCLLCSLRGGVGLTLTIERYSRDSKIHAIHSSVTVVYSGSLHRHYSSEEQRRVNIEYFGTA